MNKPASFTGLAVIGASATVDAAAIFALATGVQTAQECGGAWVLGGILMITVFSFGLVPLVIALLGIGAAKLFPQLRSPRIWLASALLLSAIAWGVVSAAEPRFPSNPYACIWP